MNKIKILIIEDELIIAKDISVILEEEGYETRIGITSVQQALKLLQEEKFNLALIDINLQQNSDGVDIGLFLLQKDTIPYIYITSHSDPLTLDRIKDSRPHGIIIKPFKPIDIKSAVAVVLSNYKLRHIDVNRNDHVLTDEVPFILKKSIQYIHENIHEKIEVGQLSELSKWSHQHFIKNFNKYMGCTPYQYILKKKIEKAQTIIVDTDLSLTAIASDFGFDSYSNFFKAFKKETGYTPDSYRKLHAIKKRLH
jgi:AraC-like DNA-binding protein/CheY-like chemotaxis protein